MIAKLQDIHKRYGSIAACDGISLELQAGNIHAILGDNGAGKSTLMKVLAGHIAPDSGSIIIDSASYDYLNPRLAKELGIAMVYQNFSLVEELTVWENIQLARTGSDGSSSVSSRGGSGSSRGGNGVGKGGSGSRGIKNMLRLFESLPAFSKFQHSTEGLEIDLLNFDMSARVSDLDMGERQQLEIAKALNSLPRILILDEPMAFLDETQTQQLTAVLAELKMKGCAIAVISHKLEMISGIADSITILEEGKVIEQISKAESRPLKYGSSQKRGRLASSLSEMDRPVLEIRDLKMTSQKHRVGFEDLNLSIRPSEIVALTDLGMNESLDGRATLVDLFLGIARPLSGKILVSGKDVSTNAPGDMKNAKVGVIPGDRDRAGCISSMSIQENLFLMSPLLHKSRIFLSASAMRELALELIHSYNILPADPDAQLSSLSGGNQQRVLLARELSANPKLLVIAGLTEGLDPSFADDIRWNIQRAAARGTAILIIGDNPELNALAHIRLQARDIWKLDSGTADKQKLPIQSPN